MKPAKVTECCICFSEDVQEVDRDDKQTHHECDACGMEWSVDMELSHRELLDAMQAMSAARGGLTGEGIHRRR